VAQEYEKLFSIDQDASSYNKNGDRWGLGVLLQGIKININNENITVTQTVVSNIELNNPILGIRIRSVSGESITGTKLKN